MSDASQRFDSAAASLAYYSANLSYAFTLANAQTVLFQIDDLAFPYFADDSGGVSLAIGKAVPEPLTVSLLGAGVVAFAMTRRRRVGKNA